MNYPLISEYVEAIKAAEENFEQLKHLCPVLDEDGEPVMSSGNFAVVFKMKDEQTGKLHAVKCFLKEQKGRAEAYRMIAEELEYVSSTFLTPIKYIDKELFVDSKNSDETEFPVLLMDWVEGMTLDKYIREHIDDQYELSLLAYQFSRLAMWLMPQPFAHGDLKPDNILVKEDGTLVLVDYDGMYVPAMKGQKARELGSPDFRHPGRTENDFDEHIDDFSLASILLSLKAISLQPSLLEEYGASDRLLFSEKDYRYLSESKVMDALKPLMQDAELASLYSLYILALSQNNLSQVSFRLFNLKRPDKLQYEEENLSTEVTEEDLANAWMDEYGVKYSADRKRLLKVPSTIVHYSILEGTKVICKYAFNNIKVEYDDHAYLKYGGEIEAIEYSISNIQSVDIPKSVIVIGDSCFERCLKLIEVSFASDLYSHGLKHIGNKAFSYCSRLSSIILPNNVTSIGNSAFKGCSHLLSITVPNSVKNIGEEVFRSCKELETVFLPNSIVTIPQSAFWGCYGLKSIVFPEDVITIEDFAFFDCRSLKFINLPKSLKYVGKRAFYLCHSIESLFVPFNLEVIKEEAFSHCYSLRSITVDKRNRFFDSREDCNAIIETKSNKLLLACFSTYIPRGVLSIGENAFAKVKHVTSISIPNSVTEIGFAAFSGCEDLISFEIPLSVKTIGDAAFLGCKRLKSISIDNSRIKVGNRLFHDCDSLVSLLLPLEGIDKFMQYDYDNKYPVRTEEGLALFSTKVTGEDLQNAWEDEYGVKYSLDRRRLLKAPHSLRNYSLKNDVVIICDNAFRKCERLSTVSIPNNVIAIGYYAFSGCAMLNSVELPPKITIIKEGTFQYCNNLISISIPENVTEIGRWAFQKCKKIPNVSLPRRIRKIGEGVFSHCEYLTAINLPEKLEYIPEEAFLYCKKLTTLGIPEGVKKIYGGAFVGCSSLQEIFLPNSLESIVKWVEDVPVKPFYRCNSLQNIQIPIGTKVKYEKLLPEYKDKLVESQM